ncbi:hypothetical protein A9497_01960 [Streptococcus thermophilus]|nr:hypothetical protein T303_06825 [Streptococcus thermophilus ASCC 1275]ANJ62154.1 hypothetical protein A9497_01960 [Streptococcus thermophilus]KOB48393.1 hypothetical protein AKL23_05530 [Streptococcus thermophilus]OIK36123.1 hypothetical protein BEL03_07265 [Streptococcus thermophilus]
MRAKQQVKLKYQLQIAKQELKLKLLNLQIMVVELINRWIHQVKHQKPRIMNHLSHLKPP